jgi:putative membrane protein
MSAYLVLKITHLLFIISWFAGLFYIFRLFVYHAKEKDNEEVSRVLSLMEAKLMKIIMVPASILVLVTGLSLIYLNPLLLKAPWMHIKLCCVVGLFLYQELARRTKNRFSIRDFYLTENQCRLINEVPTALLIAVLSMIYLRPFD